MPRATIPPAVADVSVPIDAMQHFGIEFPKMSCPSCDWTGNSDGIGTWTEKVAWCPACQTAGVIFV